LSYALNQNEFILLLTRLKHLHSRLFLLLLFSLSLCIFVNLNFSRTRTIPFTSNKIVLSSFKLSTCAWWSLRIIYSSRRHKRLHQRDKSKSFLSSPLSLSLSRSRLEENILFCFLSFYWALYLIFRIPMHHFTCELISLVELF